MVGSGSRSSAFAFPGSLGRVCRAAFVAVAVALAALVPASVGTSATRGLVAAYGFEAGSGTTAADESGSGNVGKIVNATWVHSGAYGNALSFNGSNAAVAVADSASLHFRHAMTLEAWVKPSAVSGAWRDVVYKGGDAYYLEATSTSAGLPAGGGVFNG